MFAKRSRRGPILAGGVLLAGTAALLASGYGPWSAPSAAIGGAPLGAPAAETGAPASPAAQVATPAPAPAQPAGPPELATLLDLDRIARQGDGYVATLTDGRRVALTLDPRLQALAERLLEEARAPRAAIVAMTPDGTILALAGRRAADPQPPKAADPGANDPGAPKGAARGTFDWRNATEVWAPGASVFKLVTASALLRAGVGPEDKVCYHGGLRSVLESNLHDDRRDWRCDTLAYGVAHSQNAILGKLAYQKLEPPALEAEAKLIGWSGAITGDLAGRAGATAIPAGRDLEFARSAAGFVGAKLSVLGGALLAATFANGGAQPAVHLVASVEGAPVPAGPSRRVLPEETAHAIAHMMEGTCDDGSAARVFGRHRTVRVAGKTGTLAVSAPSFIEHSWFVGYAPADKPEIVVSVLIGNGEAWHLRGHEVAKRLIDQALAPAPAPAPASTREKGRSAAVAAPGAVVARVH